ncbi:hypothetical protein LPB67_05855 [Undibacterium sp. Jales W-56]|uniref:type IV pilus assembly protein FimV n=1 Tax=Undibacterium sp. Jales W-56 TaxID=2897325 RepID=UPI0021D188FA|nr:hypothetical protein [Undibacterium sp. Jales W-56]MCU6433302.1 hypothetical protein [Undibacterium sp. Jales W-56]
MFVAALPAYALGLGDIRLQSGLGQPLKASIALLGNDAIDVNQICIKAKIETPEGGFLATGNLVLMQTRGSKTIYITTRQGLPEPAVKVTIDVACESQLHREYMLLLDPPQLNQIERAVSLPLIPTAQTAQATQVPPASALSGQGQPAVRDPAVIGVKKSSKKAKAPAPNPEFTGEAAFSEKLVPSKFQDKPKPNKKIQIEHKDVLKLSDETMVLPQGLRMSDSLTMGAEIRSASNMAELRVAQTHLAALLRGDGSDQPTTELKANQEELQSLQMQAAQLKKQSRIDRIALDELKENSFSRNWIIGLSAFVLTGLLIIATLLVYISRMHQRIESSWSAQHTEKNNQVRKNSEARKNIEDIVNSVQASYEQSAGGHFQTFEDSQSMSAGDQISMSNASRSDIADQEYATQSKGSRPRTPTLEESNSSTFNFFSTRGSSVKVEEISDVTQEAEFWMSVNDPQRAIEILEPQSLVEHPDSPVPWLYLLDLYHATNDRVKYDALRERFILFFNANIPEFDVDHASIVSRQLEDFPHLVERICGVWNSDDALVFLQSLLTDDREGTRLGFDLPVYRDILLLIAIANELERNTTLVSVAGNGWTNAQDVHQAEPDISESIIQFDPHLIDFETIDFHKKL